MIHMKYRLISEQIRLGISCESSARADNSHERSSLIFSAKKEKKIEYPLLQILLGTLSINILEGKLSDNGYIYSFNMKKFSPFLFCSACS